MRREQIFKICLNHVLTSDIEYIAKDDKTWLFCAPDFSEGEINHQQFCLRFKNGEIARDYKQAVTNALKRLVTEKTGKIDFYNMCVFGASFVFLYVGVIIIFSKNKRL